MFAKPVVAQNYTREAPQVIECATCTSSAQFEWHAANAVPVNNIRHVMVFNTATQQLNTYFVSKIYERELGFALEEVYPLPTLAEHDVAFDQYLEIAASGQLNDIHLDHPEFAPGQDIMMYGVWARAHPKLTFWAMFVQAVRGNLQPVTIEFRNGWKMKFLINPMSGGAHIFVELRNAEDIVVFSQNPSSSGSGSGVQGGNAGAISIRTSGKKMTVCAKSTTEDGVTTETCYDLIV